MSLSEEILQLLDNQNMPVLQDWAEKVIADYPAFTFPVALLLKRSANSLDEKSLKELKFRLLVNSSDPTAMAEMTDIAGDDWAHIYPLQPPTQTPTTESAIDTFLSTFGATSDEEIAVIENLIFNPAPVDYFSEEEITSQPGEPLLPPELAHKITKEENLPADEDEVTNVTISERETPPVPTDADRAKENKDSAPGKSPARGDESLLSESLAKIFIKQGRYERAFEIISNLSLNFPEKSVYFADQLRFLRKLIKNQQYQQK